MWVSSVRKIDDVDCVVEYSGRAVPSQVFSVATKGQLNHYRQSDGDPGILLHALLKSLATRKAAMAAESW